MCAQHIAHWQMGLRTPRRNDYTSTDWKTNKMWITNISTYQRAHLFRKYGKRKMWTRWRLIFSRLVFLSFVGWRVAERKNTQTKEPRNVRQRKIVVHRAPKNLCYDAHTHTQHSALENIDSGKCLYTTRQALNTKYTNARSLRFNAIIALVFIRVFFLVRSQRKHSNISRRCRACPYICMCCVPFWFFFSREAFLFGSRSWMLRYENCIAREHIMIPMIPIEFR